jgi:hypothetical protein
MKRVAFVLVAVVACSSDGGAPDAGVEAGTDASADVAQTSDVAAADVAPDAAGPACTAKPDVTSTGVPANVALTQITQDVTVTQDGTVIDAQDIHGFLTIQASHVTVKRSIVRGRATTATTAIIRIDSGTDILLEDTEVAADTPSVDLDGVWGSGFTARRMNIHGGVDGMKLGDDSLVECSYVHDLVEFASDPNQGGGATHNDCIQILSGTNITIRMNQLVAAKSDNSAIQVTQDFGLVSNLLVDTNWADGGGCTYNFSHKGGNSLVVTTSSNRFGRNSYFDCPILRSLSTTLNSSGDVWDDDGTPVPVQAHN